MAILGFSASHFWFFSVHLLVFAYQKCLFFFFPRTWFWGGKSLLENGRRHKKDEIKRTKRRKINELGQLSIMTKMHFWVVVGHLWLFALGIFASARRVGLSPLHLSKVPYLTQVPKMQLTQTIKNDRPVPYVHILSMLIHQRRKGRSSTVSGEGRRLYAEWFALCKMNHGWFFQGIFTAFFKP